MGVPSDLDFIDFKTAQEIIGGVGSPVHRATVHRLVRAGYLSPPVHPSPGISRFIRRSVHGRRGSDDRGEDAVPLASMSRRSSFSSLLSSIGNLLSKW